jgi:hypothetical protein
MESVPHGSQGSQILVENIEVDSQGPKSIDQKDSLLDSQSNGDSEFFDKVLDPSLRETPKRLKTFRDQDRISALSALLDASQQQAFSMTLHRGSHRVRSGTEKKTLSERLASLQKQSKLNLEPNKKHLEFTQ